MLIRSQPKGCLSASSRSRCSAHRIEPGRVSRLHAQAATASVQGTVTDMSGAAVPDTAVQVRNTSTSAAQTTNTDSAGRFIVSDLPVGNTVASHQDRVLHRRSPRHHPTSAPKPWLISRCRSVSSSRPSPWKAKPRRSIPPTPPSGTYIKWPADDAEPPLNGRNFEQLIQSRSWSQSDRR